MTLALTDSALYHSAEQSKHKTPNKSGVFAVKYLTVVHRDELQVARPDINRRGADEALVF
jgi:hypothetical protein